MMIIIRSLAVIFLMTILWGCDDPVYTPRPRTYPRVILPKKAYETFDKDYCCFTFKVPVNSEIQQDTSFFHELPPDPCWFDIFYPKLS